MRLKRSGLPAYRSLALAFEHLSVRGSGAMGDVTYAPTVGAIIAPWTNIKYAKKQKRLADARDTLALQNLRGGTPADDMCFVPGPEPGSELPGRGEPGLRPGERYLLEDFSGVVKPGEMMLVVGRPGSGCTTFLKTLGGLHDGYAGVDGKIHYGDMEGAIATRPYKSDIIYSSEEDVHDPNLLVGRTLDFAMRMSTPAPAARPAQENGQQLSPSEYQRKNKKDLLQVFGLEHAHDTKVGDQYVRGVSGMSTAIEPPMNLSLQ